MLVERYASRERHPGDADSERTDCATQSPRDERLNLPCETIRIDTTQTGDLDALSDQLAALAEDRYHVPSRERYGKTPSSNRFRLEQSRS